jgi:hypothetical protein
MVSMTRFALLLLVVSSGCAHRAHVTGTGSPSARVDSATFTRVDEDVVVDVQVGLSGQAANPMENPQILVRTQIPCRVGPVPPPPGFRIVYVTFNPTVLATMSVTEGFITVHRCDDQVLELSGGWDVEGIIPTALELPFQPAQPAIPIKHVELTHITVTPLNQSAERN